MLMPGISGPRHAPPRLAHTKGYITSLASGEPPFSAFRLLEGADQSRVRLIVILRFYVEFRYLRCRASVDFCHALQPSTLLSTRLLSSLLCLYSHSNESLFIMLVILRFPAQP